MSPIYRSARTNAIKAERNSLGAIVAVHVPMLTDADPVWYQRAATAAGWRGRLYRLQARTFLTAERGNAKIQKGAGRGYLSAILHLAPHQLSGAQLCAAHGACWQSCVGYNGKGSMNNDAHTGQLEDMVRVALNQQSQACRIARSRLYRLARDVFMELLDQQLAKHEREAIGAGLVPLVRPNGTSDIPWESIQSADGSTLFSRHPRTQFYDYTKVRPRALRFARGENWPENYDLTYSRDEQPGSDETARRVLESGGRVAVVVRTEPMKRSWGAPLAKLGKAALQLACERGIPGFDGVRVVSGDETDLRHLDPRGSIVALFAKGRAARDDSGFVVELEG